MSRSLIRIERIATGFSAGRPAWPGGVATGRTRTEVEPAMHAAFEFHIEGLWLAGEENPERNRRRRTVKSPPDSFVSRQISARRLPRVIGQTYFRGALALVSAVRAGVDQRKVQIALSALPLFHELLGFRLRNLTDAQLAKMSVAEKICRRLEINAHFCFH